VGFKHRGQGDKMGRFFCQLSYFRKLVMIFCKDEVAQNNGYFGLSKFITFLPKSAVSKNGLL
jgi:hypothetical protein